MNIQKESAGEFSVWLKQIKKSFVTNTSNDVPCGTCIACCSSSFFIHVEPSETKTISAIPKALLFSAPGLPKGHMILGYDQKGFCPMLQNNACSIYESRPMTCRKFDCRIFAAAGIKAGGSEKALINEKVRNWQFEYNSSEDIQTHEFIKSTAKFLIDNAKNFPPGLIPNNETQIAIYALKYFHILKQNQCSSKDGGNERKQLVIKFTQAISEAS